MADGGLLSGLRKSQCFCVFVFFLILGCAQSLDTCIEMKTAYAEKGFDENEVPVKAIPGAGLSICPQPDKETCCTPEMEQKLTSLSDKEHAQQLQKTFSLLQRTFDSRRKKFDKFFTDLLAKAKVGLHEMFVETYGLLYKQNAEIFEELFKELKLYYKGKDMDLMETMEHFFNKLLIKMYHLMSSIPFTEDAHTRCITDSMQELKPFGDVPTKLSMHVKRAFIAARTFVQGLAVGTDVVTTIMEVSPTESCLKAIVKMMYCPHCRGLTSTKPCGNYCLNTMKGCLANHAELNAVWNEYIDALDMLADRLEGPFNIESVVTPIDVEISEAIMNLQEDGAAFLKKIKGRCGEPPRRGGARKKREAQPPPPQPQTPAAGAFNPAVAAVGASGGPHSSSPHSSHSKKRQPFTYPYPKGARGGGGGGGSRDCSAAGSCLNKLVKDLKGKIRPSKDFWVQLPYMVCQDAKVAADATQQDDCWNGKDRARYVAEVQKDGVLHQINNPEVDVDVTMVSSVVSRQKVQLQHITNKLQTAYRGEDVDWVNTGTETYISGSGSGDYMGYDDDDDDEDYDSDYDGDDVDDVYGYDGGDGDDEDYVTEGSAVGPDQGRGSGGHGFVTDDERDGFVNIDKPTSTGGGRGRGRGKGHKKGGKHNYPHWQGPGFGGAGGGIDPATGSGAYSNNNDIGGHSHKTGGGRGRGRGHKKGGDRNYPHWKNPSFGGHDPSAGGRGPYDNNNIGDNNNIPIMKPGGGRIYTPSNRNRKINNNNNNNNNRGGEKAPTSDKGDSWEDNEKDAASGGSLASVGVVLLLLAAHWLAVRRVASPSCSPYTSHRHSC